MLHAARGRILPGFVLLVVGCTVTNYLQAQPSPPPPGQLLSPDQLDDLVAPIALYPDPLVSQILVAATYPLEVVQAYQFIQRNPGLSGASLTQAVQQQNWDPSVQALVVFPDVLKQLNEDITYTTNLGNAFLAQQNDVMDAIQRMRSQAEQAGKLQSDPEEQVVNSSDNGIEILPANPDVIYVPEYNPVWIWGAPRYYPYPTWYWPAAPAPGLYFNFFPGISVGAFFGAGWGGWGAWGWRPGWHDHRIIVNNNFIERHDFNARDLRSLNGTSNWEHDANHREGVPYARPELSQRYQSTVRQNLNRGGAPAYRPPEENRGGAPAARAPEVNRPAPQVPQGNRNAPFTRAPQENRGAPAQAPRTAVPQVPTERMGNRQISRGAPPAQGRTAFGGTQYGASARANADRGFSSLGPARTGGGAMSRPAAPSRAPAPAPRAAPSAPRGNAGGGRRR